MKSHALIRNLVLSLTIATMACGKMEPGDSAYDENALELGNSMGEETDPTDPTAGDFIEEEFVVEEYAEIDPGQIDEEIEIVELPEGVAFEDYDSALDNDEVFRLGEVDDIYASLSNLVGKPVDADFDKVDTSIVNWMSAGDTLDNLVKYIRVRLYTSQTYHFGGDLFGRTFLLPVGGVCHRGYEHAYVNVRPSGSVNCYFAGWAIHDPSYCVAFILVQQPGWFNSGTCTVNIYEH